MHRGFEASGRAPVDADSLTRLLGVGTVALALTALLMVSGAVVMGGVGGTARVEAAETLVGAAPATPAGPVAPTTTVRASTTSSSTTTSSTTTPTTAPVAATTTTVLPPAEGPPGPEARYVVPPDEAEPDAKQVAVDVAYSLTNYESTDDHQARLAALRSRSGADLLGEASGPLVYEGSWSRGRVVYPQMGGLGEEAASVMVVTRQTVGSGPEAEFSVVRTLDIRLVRNGSDWEFDYLSSAGGAFGNLEDLVLAHDVAADPRIEMPDSARLDIASGLVSPVLLEVIAQLAERVPIEIAVVATGHPHNVFDTEYLSYHTVGRAVDIIRVGDRRVIDDQGEDSVTRAIVEWLFDHPDVLQVGSPWDLDGPAADRSFTDEVHRDHLHIAVGDGA